VRVVRFGISDEQAWGVGLACGSTIDVLIEPELRPEVEQAARAPAGVAIVATLPDGSPGPAGDRAEIVVAPAGESRLVIGWHDDGADPVTSAARDLIGRRRSGTVEVDDRQYFVETFSPPPRLVVFGAVQAAIPLVRMARELGYRTVVADAREAFATPERFPEADDLVIGWPEDVASEIGLNEDDAVVVMTHDPKLDEPAIVEAFGAGCRYVGAMGSRRTQAGRRERLLKDGLTEEQLARLHGPIGLDLGGREPGEMALAILAEIVAERNDATGQRLSQRNRPDAA
jgi:xanthine dehydrogenase accessory factor